MRQHEMSAAYGTEGCYGGGAQTAERRERVDFLLSPYAVSASLRGEFPSQKERRFLMDSGRRRWRARRAVLLTLAACRRFRLTYLVVTRVVQVYR